MKTKITASWSNIFFDEDVLESEVSPPKIGELEDGEHFWYHNIEFVRLGEEQCGILAITAKIWGEDQIDPHPPMSWQHSQLRRTLNGSIFGEFSYHDVLTMEDANYDTVSLLSRDQWEKYKHLLPKYDSWFWLRSPYYSSSNYFCYVYSGGDASYDSAYSSYGCAPIILFRKEAVCE